MTGEALEPRDAAQPGLPRYREHHWMIMAPFLFFVVARYISLGARRAIFAAVRIEFTLGLLLTVLCIWLLLARPVQLGRARPILIAITLLFFATLLQVPFAADSRLAHDVFYDRVIKFAFLTLFMTVLIQSPRAMRWFMLAFLFSCLFITQESVRGLISGGLVWENQGVMRLHGSVPIYQHPNSLGGLAMGAIPFAVFLLPVWRRYWERGGLLLLLGTAVTCVIYTGSRTAYVALVGFLFYWWITSRKKGRWAMTALVIGAVAIAIIPSQYKERFTSITGEDKEGHSKDKRAEILRDAWQIFLENPGGVGVASFPAVRMAKFGRVQDTHNLYLEIGTNLGVQGLAVFIFLVVVILRGYARARAAFAAQRRSLLAPLRDPRLPAALRRRLALHDRDLEFLLVVCRAAAGFLWVRLLLGLFGMDLYEIYWWFCAGLAISLLTLLGATAGGTARLLALVDQELASAGPARAAAG